MSFFASASWSAFSAPAVIHARTRARTTAMRDFLIVSPLEAVVLAFRKPGLMEIESRTLLFKRDNALRAKPGSASGVLRILKEHRPREKDDSSEPDGHGREPDEPGPREGGDRAERDRHLEEGHGVREAMVVVDQLVRLLRLRVPLVFLFLGLLPDLGLLLLVALLLV